MNFKKILLYTFLGILIIIILAVIYFYIGIKKPAGDSAQTATIEIIEGETTEEIAKNLKELGIIRSPLIFQAYIFYKNVNLFPGIYNLSKGLDLDGILKILSEGKVSEEKITILEGWNIHDIAKYLEEQVGINKNEFISQAKDLEGHLFPDTYRIGAETQITEIIKKLNDNFKQKTIDLNITRDQLVLASIIEREALNDDDRAKIAGVYQNRLDIDMKLDADPTVQFAKGSWDPLTQSDYSEVISPYNTYLNNGLPPGPICNPGLASIKAAINPEKHDYFYFFHLADGTIIFSISLEEHNTNLAKYFEEL